MHLHSSTLNLVMVYYDNPLFISLLKQCCGIDFLSCQKVAQYLCAYPVAYEIEIHFLPLFVEKICQNKCHLKSEQCNPCESCVIHTNPPLHANNLIDF